MGNIGTIIPAAASADVGFARFAALVLLVLLIGRVLFDVLRRILFGPAPARPPRPRRPGTLSFRNSSSTTRYFVAITALLLILLILQHLQHV